MKDFFKTYKLAFLSDFKISDATKTMLLDIHQGSEYIEPTSLDTDMYLVEQLIKGVNEFISPDYLSHVNTLKNLKMMKLVCEQLEITLIALYNHSS